MNLSFGHYVSSIELVLGDDKVRSRQVLSYLVWHGDDM